MMKTQDSFHISKWYLDCVSESGEVLIGYAAVLHWRIFTVPYMSLLTLDEEGKRTAPGRFLGSVFPRHRNGLFIWEDKTFGISGEWKRQASPLEARLVDNEEGFLQWTCFQPVADVTINREGQPPLVGKGYVEQLNMTIRPWRIPMQTLQWGRFISPTDHLIWIEIGGKSPRQWIFFNGREFDRGVITPGKVVPEGAGVELRLEDRAVIEQEPKILNIVRSMKKFAPGFDKVIAPSFLNARETKWRSRGRLIVNGLEHSRGWCIHEVIDFRKRPVVEEEELSLYQRE